MGVDYLINQKKYQNCFNKSCLNSCSIDAFFMDDIDSLVKIKNTFFGSVCCLNACLYDAISLDVYMAPPIKEEVPNINIKLCEAYENVFKHVKMDLFILKMMKKIHPIMKLLKILTLVVIFVLGYYLLMQLNMVSYFLKSL